MSERAVGISVLLLSAVEERGDGSVGYPIADDPAVAFRGDGLAGEASAALMRVRK